MRLQLKSLFAHCLVLCALFHCAKCFDWETDADGIEWARGCDFVDNDISYVSVPSEQCGPTCKSTPECTHFAWNNLDGDACWMKKNPAKKEDAFPADGAVCGIVPNK